MSILYTFKNGWLICHEDFIRKIYENVQGKQFSFDSCLFEINTPFARAYSSNKNDVTSDIPSNLLKKKYKKRKIITPDMTDIVYIEQNIAEVIAESQKLGYFNFIPTLSDTEKNNSSARDTANNFYLRCKTSHTSNLHGCNDTTESFVTQINGEDYLIPADCRFFCHDIKDIDAKLNAMASFYDVVLLDPPWWNKYIRRKRAKCEEAGGKCVISNIYKDITMDGNQFWMCNGWYRKVHRTRMFYMRGSMFIQGDEPFSLYQMLYNEDLASIPISMMTLPGSLIAVWCTNSPSHFSSLCDVIFPAWDVEYVTKWFWVKVTHEGKPVCHFSPPPGKQPFEQIVFGRRKGGKRDQPLPEANKLLVSVPSAIHSHKPPLTDLLAPYLPPKPQRLELFARYLLPGWTSWGYEVLKLQHYSLYKELKR